MLCDGAGASADVTEGTCREANPTGKSAATPVRGMTAFLVFTCTNPIRRLFVVKLGKVTGPPPFGTSAIRVSFPSDIEICVGCDASGVRVKSSDETSTGVPQAKERDGVSSPRPAIHGVDDCSTTF